MSHRIAVSVESTDSNSINQFGSGVLHSALSQTPWSVDTDIINYSFQSLTSMYDFSQLPSWIEKVTPAVDASTITVALFHTAF